MIGEIALDTSVAVRFLNGDIAVTERVLAIPEVVLSMDDADFDYVDGLMLEHW
ncbi:hypothetical protein [Oculatella sp. FACHB-28]|uniref:hypothetical protein n=1 Tax=Oculatella sp. FACHB-28 TaxID=2692845 RepID=UPI001A7E834F|nr:hypothetical protein [Oculatella sp. FACHB-28]